MAGHLCDATTAALYCAGDFCCQPRGVRHDEVVGPEGVTLYVNQHGESDCLIEFFDASGRVYGEFRVADFVARRPFGPRSDQD